MSNNITSFVSGLLVIGGITFLTALFYGSAESPAEITTLSKEEQFVSGKLSSVGKNSKLSVSDIDIPEILPEPIYMAEEIVPIDLVEVVVVKERELVEIGIESARFSGCSWSCDGRCGLRVRDVIFHEYTAPEKEPVFESVLFPNPAIDRLTLRLTVSEEIKPLIQLYSSTGTFLQSIEYDRIHEGENDIPVNILDLPKGMYFVVLYSQEIKETIRFIKQ